MLRSVQIMAEVTTSSSSASSSYVRHHRLKWEDVLRNGDRDDESNAANPSDNSNVLQSSSQAAASSSSSSSWVEQIRMIPTKTSTTSSSSLSSSSVAQKHQQQQQQQAAEEFNVVSLNILAEQYLTPRSHPNLPKEYADVVFNKETRRKLLIDTLQRFCSPQNFDDITKHNKWDVLALQELDLHQPEDPIIPALESWGYTVVKTTSDQRRDCCAIAFDASKFRMLQMEVVQFDDLATMRIPNNESAGSNDDENGKKKITYNTIKPKKNNPSSSELTGLVRSFLRRNCALITHLQSIQSNQSFIVTSAHLYWHPGYEYVKTCQAKYLLDRVYSMATKEKSSSNNRNNSSNIDNVDEGIPTIICGDMNSKPGSIVHQLFARSSVDARTVAPWRYFWDEENEEMYTEDDEQEENNNDTSGDRKDGQDKVIVDKMTKLSVQDSVGGYMMERLSSEFMNYCPEIDSISGKAVCSFEVPKEDISSNYKDLKTTLAARRQTTHVSPQDYQHNTSPIPVRYVCDYTLNKFTRWLRILGIDVTLETESEEKERTSGGNVALFEHCRKERRTLLTTSYKLLLRRDCPPGAYLLDPKSTSSLEEALPRLLLTHGVKLMPCQFLTRCVVCNGNIVPVLDDNDKRLVFQENGAPPDLLDSKEDMEVFRCDGCRQGYWWDDRPSSSASRVFTQATKLFRLALNGGVAVDMPHPFDERKRKEVMGAFDFVDVEREQQITTTESELNVIQWLRDDKLRNPYRLQSAYAVIDKKNAAQTRESIQFTNVTSDFVGLLDYVFFEPSKFEQTGYLYVPTSLKSMNHKGITGGHLIPSNTWPSDHLAVGARLAFRMKKKKKDALPNSGIPIAHPIKCGCGCVPNVLSLFEMAELRKRAREAARAS